MTFLQRHAYGFGSALAACLWPFFPGRRRISVENILRAGVTDDPSEARRLAKRAWCHLAGHIGEALFVPGVVTKDNWREHLDFEGCSPTLAKLVLETPDRPILIVSAHHGVWEAATNVLSFARPMMAVARPVNNRFVQGWMKRHHFRGDVTIVDKNRGFSASVLRQWAETKAGLAILIDQHTSGGALLRFFGRPAKTFTSATRLGMRTGFPIAVGSFVRVAPYRYRFVGGDPVVLDKKCDRDESTQLLNDRLEAAIRAYPEQYLWCHRRWRNG